MVDKKDLISDVRSRKKGIAVYRENPFWEPTEIKVGTKTIRVARGRHISNEGESVQHSGIHIIEQVDRDEFVKLYTKNIKTFFDLKPSTQKVLQVILHIVQKNPGSDAIYLPFFEVQDYSKKNDWEVSKASFHNAMREMLNKGFLAEAEAPNKYWINPHLFFNGDRMTFIREYRLKNKKIITNDVK